jgi:two-component system, cell cycle response regulator
MMKKRTVLVIEDDPLNRKLVHALLSLGGYAILEAADAEAGLAIARENPPDCIIMDLRLPGMDGFGATRLLKQDPVLKAVPVIALTAFAMGGDERKAIEAGCDAYITKPIENARFMGTITTLLQRAAPQAEAEYGRVLIVDDEPMVTRLLSVQLRKAGWETVVASGGEEAIRVARENPPDLILMDVLMPGLNGYEATRRLKSDLVTMHIPIILLTGLSDVQNKLDGLEAGADEFLSKPISAPELIVRIKGMLRLRRYEEQLRHRSLSDGFSGTERGAVEPTGGRPQSARILLLEAEGSEQTSLRENFEGQGYRVAALKDGAERLLAEHEGATDLVILDAALPAADTFEICRRMKEKKATRNVPLVVIADAADSEGRIRYLSLGVDELLSRPLDSRELTVRVGRLLTQKAHLDSLESRYQSALVASVNDGLTGLFNHAYFKRFLELEAKRSQRQNHPTSLVLLDIDDFKSKNDSQGHSAGDLILSEVARRIRSSVREIDLTARYGGEEFAVVLPYTDQSGAAVVAERIRAALASEDFLVGTAFARVKVTASIGVASCPENGRFSEDLVRAADSMLYQAKKEGKNRVCRMGSAKA